MAAKRRCEYCMWWKTRNSACGCSLYNAGVAAQNAAAQSIADARHPGAQGAWLNEYGVFAVVNGVSQQVGTAQEAAPFVALTSQMNRVASAILEEEAKGG